MDLVDLVAMETPPRAWGRLNVIQILPIILRNTPTGVGKTHIVKINATLAKKHPHGRGEDACVVLVDVTVLETPPRAWGRQPLAQGGVASVRNTPTGVGKTRCRMLPQEYTWKHPHGRGEDVLYGGTLLVGKETPPRAWGRLF